MHDFINWIQSLGFGLWDVMAFVSYSLFALSYAMRDMRLLRTITIGGASLDILIFLNVRPGQPMWVQVVFSGIFVTINAYQLYALWRDTHGRQFDGDAKFLFETVFKSLTPGECRRLLSMGTFESLVPGDRVLHMNQAVDHVTVLADGELAISREGNILTHMKPGTFVGEMGYISQRPASVNVHASTPSRVWRIACSRLHHLESHHPELHGKLTGLMGRDIADKLRNATLIADTKDRELSEFRSSQFATP